MTGSPSLDADQMALELAVAYARLDKDRDANFGAWWGLQRQWVSRVRGHHESQGFTAPRAFWQSQWRRLIPFAASVDANSLITQLYALATDWTPDLEAHWEERHAQGANVVAQVTGYTGSAKSSATIHLADTFGPKPIEPARLDDHLCFDVDDMLRKLPKLRKGETLIHDEYNRAGGEGSRTLQETIRNLEDQLRATMVNLFWLSPTAKNHDTATLELEAFAVNRDEKKTRFLAWVEGHPMGFVTVPWCRAALWEAYSPWKARNLWRAVNGQFRPNLGLGKLMMELFSQDDFYEFLAAGNKPKKVEIEAAVELFCKRVLPTKQQSSLVNVTYTALHTFQRTQKRFEAIYEVQPNDRFRELAKKCYEE